jgi:DNA-directed RNA polymerase subunit RPC12/RpoP
MNPRSLQAGDELRCPHCRRWHRLIQKHSATVRMLYFECRGSPYFGGFIDAGSRHETRKAADERSHGIVR